MLQVCPEEVTLSVLLKTKKQEYLIYSKENSSMHNAMPPKVRYYLGAFLREKVFVLLF
jgi:hypothetical protein